MSTTSGTMSGLLICLLAASLTACAVSATPQEFSGPERNTSGGGATATAESTALAAAAPNVPASPTAASAAASPSPAPTSTTAPTAPPTSAPTSTASPAPATTPTELADRTGAASADEQLVARGIEIYRANFCGTCHTLDVAGTHGIFGPTHNGVATTAAQRVQQPGYTGAATTAEGYIRESLRDPNIYHVPGYSGGRFSMPVFTDLDPADLDALVYMLLQQK